MRSKCTLSHAHSSMHSQPCTLQSVMHTQPCTLSHALSSQPRGRGMACTLLGKLCKDGHWPVPIVYRMALPPPPLPFPPHVGDFVEETFGPAVWAQALAKAGLSHPLPQPWVSSCPYHDRIIYRQGGKGGAGDRGGIGGEWGEGRVCLWRALVRSSGRHPPTLAAPPALSPVSRSHPHTPPSPGSHYRSLLEAACEIVEATPLCPCCPTLPSPAYPALALIPRPHLALITAACLRPLVRSSRRHPTMRDACLGPISSRWIMRAAEREFIRGGP